jgi:protein gp37
VEKITNRIGWCSATFNPVIGCKNNCSYCYAKKMNDRFKFIKNWNNPEWEENNFKKDFPKKPQRIFVGSMSEIYYWKEEWMEKVIEKVKQYPQHVFQFLTKFPEVYAKYLWEKNCWFGATMTGNKRIEKAFCIPNRKGLKFLSIEPILEKIDIEYIDRYNPKWVIIGAETGNRKGKVIPKIEWIENIVDYCKRNKISIYLKDSLKGIYPVEIKEFPKEYNQ